MSQGKTSSDQPPMEGTLPEWPDQQPIAWEVQQLYAQPVQHPVCQLSLSKCAVYRNFLSVKFA
jgi:hypothetical protein